MTNSDMTPQASHMSYQDFSDAAPFGRYNLADFQSWPLSNDALTRHFMPIWFFFYLHMQSIVLNALLYHFYKKFLHKNINKRDHIERGIQLIIKDALKLFYETQSINEYQTFTSLSKSVEELYNNIVNGISRRYADIKNDEAHKDFKEALEHFIETITTEFTTLQENIRTIQSSTSLPYDMMQCCLSVLQEKHEMGRKLARAFFGYNEDQAIPMSIVIPKVVDQFFTNRDYPERFKGEALKTLNNTPGFPGGERYIRFTFSPLTFLWEELLRLPLEFFHEYISHLAECIYPHETKPSDDMKAMDEGWMMYVAESFFDKKGAKLLSDGVPDSLLPQMRSSFKKWTHDLTHYNEKGRESSYDGEAELGYTAAEQFLEVLLLAKMDNEEANELFYRLSFDLITYSSKVPRWHSIFIDTVYTCFIHNKEALVRSISQYRAHHTPESITHLGVFFWSQIEQYRPESKIWRDSSI